MTLRFHSTVNILVHQVCVPGTILDWTESREQNKEFCPHGACALVQEMCTSIHNIKSVGDKCHDKGNTGEKSYWSVYGGRRGKAAILGGWRSGCSMDMTFKKILKEVNRPCDDNSPISTSRADLYWDPESYPTASCSLPLDVSGHITLNVSSPTSQTPQPPTHTDPSSSFPS